MEYLPAVLGLCSFLCCIVQVHSAQQLRYSIQEELLPGTFVANIFADSHIEEEGRSNLAGLRFRFLTQSSLDFTIEDRTGIIRIGSQIDRDLICPQQLECHSMLDVVAVVKSSSKFFRIFKIIIEIIDINDNSPTFPEPEISHYILESTQPGSNFVIPTAADPDSGVNGIKGYELIPPHGAFSLQALVNLDGSTDLRLVLKTRLDRERQASYKVKVIAYDGGNPSRSGTVDVLIPVQDTNDNTPTFENSTYIVNIPENIPIQSTIVRVHAVDSDMGLYGQVVYQFSTHTKQLYGSLFGIRNSTGDIYVKDVIDFEKGAVYHLSINAQDLGPDSLHADATVVIKVTDVNDHSPDITVNTLDATNTDEAEISEDSDIGTFVAHVHVLDRDSGSNGNFSCVLNDNHNHFELESLYQGEYQVITTVNLDREEWPQYTLSIMCKDQGMEPQVSIRHIKVFVLDANDNAPLFDKDEYTAWLVENNYLGAFIVEVKASDMDLYENAQLWYKLHEDAMDRFSLDALTGKITTAAVFDHEKESIVQFHVLAIDRGTPPLTGTVVVTVHIEDVNDERPVFSQDSYSFSVEENQPEETEVGIVAASDPDSKLYSTFVYSLVPSYLTVNTFTVDSQAGIIMTKVPLDRESQAVYYLSIVVKDAGIPPLSSSCSVTVHVADTNDNNPVFDFPSKHNNSIHISNMVPHDYVVTRITAHDPDIGYNGNVSYDMINGDDMFKIDSTTGHISVAAPLSDIEFEVFELVVTAEDHGEPQRSVKSSFNIVVNKSVHYPYDRDSGSMGRSVAIVGGIAVVSGILMIILILAIVALRHKDRRHKKNQKYNCHMEPLKMIPGEGSLPSSPNRFMMSSATGLSDHQNYTASIDNTYSQLPLNHTGSEQGNYEVSGTSASATQNPPPAQGEDELHSTPAPHLARPWSLSQKELEVHQLLDMIKQDQDADSAYSGESSNTDSGRGLSEEGDGAHRVPHNPYNTGSGRGHRVHPGSTSTFTGDPVANSNQSVPQAGTCKPNACLSGSHYNHQMETLRSSSRKPGCPKSDSPNRAKIHGNHNHYSNHTGHSGYPHRSLRNSSRTPHNVPNISQTIPEESIPSAYGYYQGNTFYVQGSSKKDTIV